METLRGADHGGTVQEDQRSARPRDSIRGVNLFVLFGISVLLFKIQKVGPEKEPAFLYIRPGPPIVLS